jgi:hypothetical protein
MARRQTRFQIKNNPNSLAPFSGATLLAGEPIVNTAAGIMMFSGVTTGPTADWVSAGDGAANSGGNNNFFEVGSNLYNLKIRNKITSYGSGSLAGKFLSGTTNGFELADITSIQGVNNYVTGGTLTSATTESNEQTTTLSYNVNPAGTPFTIKTQNTFTTGGTYDNSTKIISFKLNDSSKNFTVSLSSITTTDTYVTGFTYDPLTNKITLSQNGQTDLGLNIKTVSGLTVDNLVAGQVVYAGTNKELKSDSDFAFNENENKLSVTNLSVNNANSAATFGNGGVIIGSGGSYVTPGTGDLTVHGSLTVFGPSISAFTSELYIEDKNIILNYNPTGSSQSTSVGAGITIQDGQGTGNGDVAFQLASLDTLTGNTGNPNPSVPYSTEYTSGDGYNNRGWVTQLNDIVIRSENINTPRGVRVLAEFDVLDGGQY